MGALVTASRRFLNDFNKPLLIWRKRQHLQLTASRQIIDHDSSVEPSQRQQCEGEQGEADTNNKYGAYMKLVREKISYVRLTHDTCKRSQGSRDDTSQDLIKNINIS